MSFTIENARVVRDIISTVKIVGPFNGVPIVVNNCHLTFTSHYGTCLYGNHVFINGIFHYRSAFCKFIGNDKYRIIPCHRAINSKG